MATVGSADLSGNMSWLPQALFTVLALSSSAFGQDLSLQGGQLTTDSPGRFALQLPAPSVVDPDRHDLQLSGFTAFHQIFSTDSGLGPGFVNSSCGGCHVENGRGPVRFSASRFGGSTAIVKIGLPGSEPDGSRRAVPGLGVQLHDHAVSGRSLLSATVTWRTLPGRYKDGLRYTLRRPVLAFRFRNGKRRSFLNSLRMTPAVVGPGLLEAIPESVILERHDPDDLNGDGISGRVNMVPDQKTKGMVIGRFGFKASHPTLAQQTAGAFFHDMGVTSSFFTESPEDIPELPDDTLDRLVAYQALGGVPRARNLDDPEVEAGKRLFFEVGCEACHRVNLVTGSAAYPELEQQVVHPYTDLLLHDMGPGLADKLSEFSAQGSEWRTTPLWGLTFVDSVSSEVRDVYLHDGRARTLEEAIIWHGGEAQSARNRFVALPKVQRDELVSFLRSL